MKKTLTGLLSVLILVLSACSGGESTAPAAYDPASTAQALLDSGAFTQELGELAPDMAVPYLGLTEEPEEAVIYTSMEGGYEELAVLTFSDEAAAQTALENVQTHVSAQVETEADTQYKPEDLPKLNGARTEQAGNSVLLVVAADYGKVQEALDGLADADK